MSEEIEPAAVMKVCDTCNYIEYVMPTRQAYARQGDVDDCAENDMKEVLTVRVSEVVRQLDKILTVPPANETDTVEDRVDQFRDRLRDLEENDSGLNSTTEGDSTGTV